MKKRTFLKILSFLTILAFVSTNFAPLSNVSAATIDSKKVLLREILDNDESNDGAKIRYGLIMALDILDGKVRKVNGVLLYPDPNNDNKIDDVEYAALTNDQVVDAAMTYSMKSFVFQQTSSSLKSDIRDSYLKYRTRVNLNQIRADLVRDALYDIIITGDDFDITQYATAAKLATFPNITKEINNYLLGVVNDNRGVMLLLSMLRLNAEKNGEPIASSTTNGLLQLGIVGHPDMQAAMTFYLDTFYRDDSTVDGVFSDLEQKVNQHTLDERTKFYEFLDAAQPFFSLKIFNNGLINSNNSNTPTPSPTPTSTPSSSQGGSAGGGSTGGGAIGGASTPTPNPSNPAIGTNPTPTMRIPAGGIDLLTTAVETIQEPTKPQEAIKLLEEVKTVYKDIKDFTPTQEQQLQELITKTAELVGKIEVKSEVVKKEDIQEALNSLLEVKKSAEELGYKPPVPPALVLKVDPTLPGTTAKLSVDALKELNNSDLGIKYEDSIVSFALPPNKINVPEEETQPLAFSGRVLSKTESESLSGVSTNEKSIVLKLEAAFGNTKAQFNNTDGTTTNSTIKISVKRPLAETENFDEYSIFYLSFNEKTGQFEKVLVRPQTYDPAIGSFVFEIPHFSDYLIDFKKISFNDLSNFGWASKSITSLAAKEVIFGMGSGRFEPSAKLTRAQVVTMLTKAFSIYDENAKSEFADITKDAWYYKAISSAYKQGLVKGREDGTFAPNEPIKREDLAVILLNVANKFNIQSIVNQKAKPSTYSDRASIRNYAVNAVDQVSNAGIFAGYPGNKFEPALHASRAEAAVVVDKLFKMK